MRNTNCPPSPPPSPSNRSRNESSLSKNNRMSGLISSRTKIFRRLGVHLRFNSNRGLFGIKDRNRCHCPTWPHSVSVEEQFRADSRPSLTAAVRWQRTRCNWGPNNCSFHVHFSHFLQITTSVPRILLESTIC